jgi:hypothetical protein
MIFALNFLLIYLTSSFGSTSHTGAKPNQQQQQTQPNPRSHNPTYRAGQAVPSISLLSPSNSNNKSSNAKTEQQQASTPTATSSFSPSAPTYAQSLSHGQGTVNLLSSNSIPANKASASAGNSNSNNSHASAYAPAKRGHHSNPQPINQRQQPQHQQQKQAQPIQSRQQQRQNNHNNQQQQPSNAHNHFSAASTGTVSSPDSFSPSTSDSLSEGLARAGDKYLDNGWDCEDEDTTNFSDSTSFPAAHEVSDIDDDHDSNHGHPLPSTSSRQQTQLASPPFHQSLSQTAQRYIPPHVHATYGLTPPLSATSFYSPSSSVSGSGGSNSVGFRPIGEERTKQQQQGNSSPNPIGGDTTSAPSNVSGSHMKDLFNIGSSQLAGLGGPANTGAPLNFSMVVGSEKYTSFISSNSSPFNTSPHASPFLSPSNSSSSLNLTSNPDVASATVGNAGTLSLNASGGIPVAPQATIAIPPHIPSPHPSDLSILALLGACKDLMLDCEGGLFSLDHILTLKPDFLLRKGIANAARVSLVQNLRSLGAKNDFILDCLEIPWSLADVLQMDNQSLLRKGMDLEMVARMRENFLY